MIPVRLLLESVGVCWLAVVTVQYALRMLDPSAPDLSHVYLPLLASTLIAGIISYYWYRPKAPPDVASPEPSVPSGQSQGPKEVLDGDEHPA